MWFGSATNDCRTTQTLRKIAGWSRLVANAAITRHETTVAADSLKMPMKKRGRVLGRWSPAWLAAWLAVSMLICGCSGVYFRPSEKLPPHQQPVTEWPVRDYWKGIVFNGSRIGFAHFTMSPVPGEKRLYDIRSEAYLHIRMLWMDKTIHLRSFDRVHTDLTLQHFHYVYNLDGNRLTLVGQLRNGILDYTLQTRGQTTKHSTELQRPLVPTSATGLYPLLHGVRIGMRHQYDVFDGQSQRVSRFDQEVVDYEESDLFAGSAFRIVNRFRGQKVTTWIDSDGIPLLEMSMGGILIAALEDEIKARRLLSRAVLNKEQTLIEFSRIASDRIIDDPHRIAFMKVRISGIQKQVTIPSDFRQRCRTSGEATLCTIDARPEPAAAETHRSAKPAANSDSALRRYLQPTTAISAGHPRIQRLAAETAPASADRRQQVQKLVEWMQVHIQREPVDVFTALDVLETRKAECQGHALLLAALARSSGIPTRIVNGIVYVPEFDGFLYHSWNECYIDGGWTAVDPTFGQVPADATHLKLVEGHNPADLTPLLDFIGRIQVAVLTYR